MKRLSKASQKRWAALTVVLFAVAISICIYIARLQQYADWQMANGVVLQVERYTTGGKSPGSKRHHRIDYAYTVSGVEYTASDSYAGYDSDFAAGDRVEIWYDPGKPSLASFHKPHPGLDPYVPYFFAAPLVLGLLGWGRKTAQRKRRTRRKGSSA